MKKTLLLFLSFCFVFTAFSQNAEIDKSSAFAIVKHSQKELGFSAGNLDNVRVMQSYKDSKTGTVYIYLQQTYKGILVHNKIIVLAYKNGKLVSKAGSLFENPEAYANAAAPAAAIPAQTAVRIAAAHVHAKEPQSVNAVKETDGRINFGNLGIAYEDITAQQYWLPVEKAGSKTSLKLIWQVLIAPVKTDDMWYVRVDAEQSTVINKTNLTVFEKFEAQADHIQNHRANTPQQTAVSGDAESPSIVGTANYLVVPYPIESPLYGSATTVTNPWTLAGASNPNAVSLKWHNDGAVDYTISRGNNAWATEDRANTNSGTIITPTGLPATSSTTPDPLNFTFTPDYTVAPTTANFQQFAITNLFYWNNIVHDMAYNYGFDEAAGNFQANNQGRGGSGNDYVIAIAQSASGTNNANFATPPDGTRPRMRMYLFTAPNPDRDGDLDAGIMSHEYTHGISNRLTGGIAGGGGCLSNDEEGGEGWSDYMGLMMTTNWATAQITDGFNVRRPIGNYALGQSAAGNGFRNYPYCTNMAVNPLTYAIMNGNANGWGEVHNIGEIWCAALWDMTWGIIQMDGINPNLFNASGVGGNTVALKLVLEGMKLQPCSPGFLDARDAILRADQNLYNGRYHCAILAAFARRGMGTDAKQGSSASTADQTAGFSVVESTLTLTQSLTQQAEGLNVTYTNRVTAGACAPLANFNLTDTLPANVTYVSGGSYNTVTRVVNFPVNLSAGTSADYSFTVQINSGAYFPTVNLFEDVVTGTSIPAAWTSTATAGANWVVSNARSHTPPSSYFSINTTAVTDKRLTLTTPLALGATPPNLTFWHWFNTESTYDGGVLEISTDGGTTFGDIGSGNFITGGYTATMDASTVLAGRGAWSGSSSGFMKTVVNLTSFANQSVKFRFRSTTDNGTALEGWYVDDISVKKVATVDIRSSLFNSSGIRVQVADTFTIILPPAATCVSTAISAQPQNATACTGGTATFSVTATGTTPLYQWQVSTDGGTVYTDVPGATSATLTLTGLTAAMNGYKYKVAVSNTCPSAVTSSVVTLTVNNAAAITTQPAAAGVCQGSNATFTVAATGTAITYQWQVSTDGGTTFTNITGATAATLTLTGVTAAMNNNQYHVVVSNACPSSVTSNNVTLTVQPPTAIATQPVSASTCAGTSVSFSVAATGGNLTYQWYTAAACGGTFTIITGATGATLTLNNVTAAQSGTAYQVVVSGSCAPASVTSSCAVLTVNNSTTVTTQPNDVTVCAGTAASFTAAATGGTITYQWQVSTDGGTTYTNIAGAISGTYSIAATTVGQNGNRYRALISSQCAANVPSNAALLTVQSTPAITVQPSDINSCSTTATFTVTATGTGIVYQWQLSTDGGVTYTNIPGANAATYTVSNLTPAMATYRYRVVISTTSCGTVTSNSVTARVGTTPVVVLTAAAPSGNPNSMNPAYPSGLYTTVSPVSSNYTYQWKRNGIVIPVTLPYITPANGIFDDFGTYQVTVTDITTGCSGVSNIVTVSDISIQRDRLFISPNPTQGIVFLSYYSSTTAAQARTVNVYDGKGARLMAQPFTTTGSMYGRMRLDLSALPKGIYMVELRDATSKKIASDQIIKL